MSSTQLVDFDLQLDTESYRYRTPMKFGGRVVEDVTVLNARCSASNKAGGNASGLGSMTMGVAWAWPDASVPDETKLQAVLDISKHLANAANESDKNGHPMEVCLRLAKHRETIATLVAKQHALTSPIPELAVLLAGSPIEAALFDAHGKACSMSSYALLGQEHLPLSLGEMLNDDRYRSMHLDQFISPTPVATLPLYHLVGALDPLTPGDLIGDGGKDLSVGDGLPETLGDWISRNELTHLKIKLSGDDRKWDYERIVNIDTVAQQTTDRGNNTGKPYLFSLDFNERCQDEEYVLGLISDLHTNHPETLARVQYIEQPTARDLKRPGAVTMHRVAKQKPVVIDESLTDLESLDMAVSQGYSGIALKACKGHAEAILLGAVAKAENLFLCVQDLTCVGASLLHSASLSAHIPGVAAVESNGRQYCPAGNEQWMASYGPMFEIEAGQVPTNMLSASGLGYAAAETAPTA